MECELVEDSSPPERKTNTEIFNEIFPYYLSIGMTHEQFWDEDACLVKFYRKAERIKNDKINEQMWMQGMYFKSALDSVIGNMFKEKGADPIRYTEEPFPLDKKQKEQQELNRQKRDMELQQAKFKARASLINKKFEKKEG